MSADLLHLVCAHCWATNRLPGTRLTEQPNCGRCHQPLFTARPAVLNEQSFGAFTQNSDLPVIVDFWAPWCGPCLQFAPHFAAAAARLEPHVRLAKLDTEAHAGISARLGIRSIPTLIAFRQGRELERVTGAMPQAAFVDWARRVTA